MRVCYVILVVAVTLLASIADVSASTDLDQTQLSHMESPDSINAVEATQRNTQRFLRRHKADNQDEERGGNVFRSFRFVMKEIKGKNAEEALRYLQILKLPVKQRQAILDLHMARLAKATARET